MNSVYIPDTLATRVQRQRDYMEVSGQITFHRVAIAEVKQRVDKVCTYLSHLTKKKEIQVEIKDENGEVETVNKIVDRIYFLAHLIIKGEKKIVRFDTGKNSSSELVAEDYKVLKEQIEKYVTGKETI